MPGSKGRVHVRLMFQPEIIAKSRKNTSTFSTAGRAMTQVGVLPLSAGKGVIQGVTGLFKSKEADEVPAIPELPAGQASVPIVQPATLGTLGSPPLPDAKSKTSLDGTHEPGTLRVTVLDAKDLPSADYKPYATIRSAWATRNSKRSMLERPQLRSGKLGLCFTYYFSLIFAGMKRSFLLLDLISPKSTFGYTITKHSERISYSVTVKLMWGLTYCL